MYYENNISFKVDPFEHEQKSINTTRNPSTCTNTAFNDSTVTTTVDSSALTTVTGSTGNELK